MDAFSLELLFQNVPLVPLEDAAREMDGLDFFHGSQRVTMTFRFRLAQPALETCRLWAESEGPEDARQALGVEKLAAVRAWTCTPLCYVLSSVLRDRERTAVSVQPVLKYGHLLFSGLHAMPEVYLVIDATLYRAQNGAIENEEWSQVTRPADGILTFHLPTSFSSDPAVMVHFKDTAGERALFQVHGACGYNLEPFSAYPHEHEVLVEGVCRFHVTSAEKFDARHPDVLAGEVKAGLHKVKGQVQPGVPMLEGSKVKAAEAEVYRKRLAQEQAASEAARGAAGGPLDLELAPFTEEEWTAKGKPVPKKDRERRMSTLGKGGFMTTLRKRVKPGGVGPEGCTRFAVKVVDRDDMPGLGITEADVRREASTLARLRHTHIIRYHGVESSDDEIGIVMELAEGGSLADLIKERAAPGGVSPPEGVSTTELREIMRQAAKALDYIHGQGVIHRDIKAHGNEKEQKRPV